MIRSTAFSLVAVILLSGCAASSSYYTGKTLEEKKLVLTFSADDIILKSADRIGSTEKNIPFTPSFGIAYGFPARFEGGLRYYPIRYLEGYLRYQVNPPSFTALDGSLDLHLGQIFGAYSFVRYGATISTDLGRVEPYGHVYAYKYLGSGNNDVVTGLASDILGELVSGNRSLGFGVALTVQRATFFPEVNYQYYVGEFPHGLWHFGVGLRIPLNQGAK